MRHPIALDDTVRFGRDGPGIQQVPTPRPQLQGTDPRSAEGTRRTEVLHRLAQRMEGISSLLGRGRVCGVSIVTQVREGVYSVKN